MFSIVLISRNGGNTLPRLAESISPFIRAGGEVVLLDTGSTDDTMEIATALGFDVYEVGEKFTEKLSKEDADAINADAGEQIVTEGQRVFDFAAARNAAAELAHNDWIVCPDSDEVLTIDEPKLLELMKEGVGIVRCQISDGLRQWETTRCYNRKLMKWNGKCHEWLGGQGTQVTAPKDVLSLTHFQHPSEERPGRIAALALEALRNPTARNLYYYGRELTYRAKWKSAIPVLERQTALPGPAEERAQAFVLIGDAHNALGDKQKALEAWERAYKACPSRRIGLLRLAKAAYERSDWPEVVRHALPALAIKRSWYVEEDSDFGALPHKWLYPALWQTGNKELSKEHYVRAFVEPDEKTLDDKRWYFAPKVSIVVPTLGRPEKLARCLAAIAEHAEGDYEVIVEHDSFEDRQGCPKTLKKGVERATGDFVMFLGNDCVPQKGFISEALKVMNTLPGGWGLVALYDSRHEGRLATHWMASKRLLPFLGGEFFSTEYEHTFCDNEITDRCKALGRYAYAPLSRIGHDHPLIGGDVITVELPNEHLKPKTELCLLAEKYKSDKVASIFHAYTTRYHELLADRKDSIKRILEVGIGSPDTMAHVGEYVTGASLFMWRDFLPNAQVFGIDISPSTMVSGDRIVTAICDQSKASDLEKFATDAGGDFDFIVDDGSHVPEHQAITVKALMPFLSDDGIYVIEDIHDPELLISLIGKTDWRMELDNLNIAFSKWDRLLIIRKAGKGLGNDKILKIAYDDARMRRDHATYERRKALMLPFTGERVVPDKMQGYEMTLAEHLARYRFAKDHVTGRTLDAACGTGYGTAILGADGCDVSEEALAYARATQAGKFFKADLSAPDMEAYDTVTSFETIEHLKDPRPFIEWVRGHAKQFIFSIPIDNPSDYHEVVYSVEQVMALMSDFMDVKWYEQNGTMISPLKSTKPTFLIGVANV
jgi:glycosyltransferase involved in cell wall biosynthesis/SAM-dependent methyltransferase